MLPFSPKYVAHSQNHQRRARKLNLGTQSPDLVFMRIAEPENDYFFAQTGYKYIFLASLQSSWHIDVFGALFLSNISKCPSWKIDLF